MANTPSTLPAIMNAESAPSDLEPSRRQTTPAPSQLAEMSALLAAYPCVEQACVIPSIAADGSVQLSAYLTTQGNCSVSLAPLAAYLERRVQSPLFPAFYLHRDSLPLLANGDVDQLALLSGLSPAVDPPAASRAPASDIEKRVMAAVRETVGTDDVTLDDNFFDVGGHSLLGTQFVMRARRLFGVKVTLRDVFEAETVAALAERIEQLIFEDIDSLSDQDVARLNSGHAA